MVLPAAAAASERCGARKAVDGGGTLVCNLEAHAAGTVHGIRQYAAAAPYVTWPDAWVIEEPFDRLEGWRKPHKRREYQTLATWKARNL